MVARSYRTAKGTELPLLNLRGKQYLEVKFRLVWFREEHPDWSIETELISVTESSAYSRASIKDEKGRLIATSHKFESVQGFPDFIEKAETGAIGRALALIGYGTQFCADELDEGKRIVDSPVGSQPRSHDPKVVRIIKQSEDVSSIRNENSNDALALYTAIEREEDSEEETSSEPEGVVMDPSQFRIGFGRKYKGKRLKEIPRKEMEGYLKWLEGNAIKEGTTLSYQVRLLKDAFDRMYSPREKTSSH